MTYKRNELRKRVTDRWMVVVCVTSIDEERSTLGGTTTTTTASCLLRLYPLVILL